MNEFFQEFQVRSYHVYADNELNPASLINFLLETAGLHANALNFGMKNLFQENNTWMLSRMYMQIDRWPQMGETITIKTWPSGIERLFATRDFFVLDQNQSIIAKAITYWLVIDRQSKRPKSPDYLKAHVQVGKDRALDIKLDKIAPIKSPGFSDKRHTFYSDTDINGHVTSVRYTEWMLNTLPHAIISSQKLFSYQINFLSELFPGIEVMIQIQSEKDGIYIGSVRPEGSDKESCRALMVFK